MLSRKYIPALDGLRAVAVGLVMAHHLSARAFPGGNIGVDIFFVLSGYLISNILIREYNDRNSIWLMRFYKNRMLRLMPALLLLIGCDLVVNMLFPRPNSNEQLSAFAAFAYTMDFVRAFSKISEISLVGHTWSLAVEEQFYIIWPVLLIGFLKIKSKLRIIVPATFLVIVVLWRMLLLMHGADADRIFYSFDTRADQLLVGCMLAMFVNSVQPETLQRVVAPLRLLGPLALICVVAMTCLVFHPGFEGGGIGFTLNAVLAAVVIADITLRPVGMLSWLLAWKPMVWLGTISYGVYLWHYPLLFLAGYWGHESGILRIASLLLTIPIAALSRRYIELPFLLLKQYYKVADAKGNPVDSTREAGSPVRRTV